MECGVIDAAKMPLRAETGLGDARAGEWGVGSLVEGE